jgi:cyclophilin family peptidyl-prolyl cis-trans isomerase
MRKLALILLAAVLSTALHAQAVKQKTKPKAKPKAKTETPAATGSVVEISTTYGNIKVLLYDLTPLHRDNFLKLVREHFYDSLLFHRVIRGFMIQGGDPESKHADSAAQLGSGDMPYRIPAEINAAYYHKRGALAAARDNNPEKASSGCQFYIVQGHLFNVKDLEAIMNNKNISKKQELLYKVYQSDSVQNALRDLQTAGDKEGVRKYMDRVQAVVNDLYDKEYHYNFTPGQIRDYLEIGGAPHLDGDYTVFGEVIDGMPVVDKIASEPTRSDARPIKDIRMKMRIVK